MEKTTKKKKSKSLKRRIGLIAIGGLSLVLTVCLSVGATLAWFAGSTNASNTMYMGGPVYVEMAGRGAARGTNADGTADGAARWVGGSGNLDIIAAARTSGTVKDNVNGPARADYSQILLPGQRLMIYSQARVFSTSETSTVNDGWVRSQSSGSNNTNMQNGTARYKSKNGRVTTTTTSVLRAKFSVNVEFDPSVGINNFTTEDFATNYPVKSQTDYTDEGTTVAAKWYTALGAQTIVTTSTNSSDTFTYNGRRDAVNPAVYTQFVYHDTPMTGTPGGNNGDYSVSTAPTSSADVGASDLLAIKNGTKTSIYKWKYVSREEYYGTTAHPTDASWRMGCPFDGTVNSAGGLSNSASSGGVLSGTGNGYYGLWVSSTGDYETAANANGGGTYVESDAFYKARTQSYLKSYREAYHDEYERDLVMGYELSLTKLEDSLNESFTSLVNWSSDAILSGTYARGFSVTPAGVITADEGETGFSATSQGKPATWLYVDPRTPGAQDTNASDDASGKAGWWYLVKSYNNLSVSTGANVVSTKQDKVTQTGDVTTKVHDVLASGDSGYQVPFQRVGTFEEDNGTLHPVEKVDENDKTKLSDTEPEALFAELFEISPDTALGEEVIGTNGSEDIVKTVSISFPFVNGSFALPGKELTNNFANAKITFQITFQALQAFFPYTRSIDGFNANDSLLGIGKVLNIKNAIPIYNEAFDYLAYL